MTRDPSAPAITAALAAIDVTLLVGVPVVMGSAAISLPHGQGPPLQSLAAVLAATWVLALLGRLGRAPWRRYLYPVAMLGIAGIGFWTQGPTAGVGAAFGLAVLLAGALSSRLGLWLVVAAGIVTISVSPVALPITTFESLPTWIRMALTIGVVTWIATLVLDRLIASLELSYARTAEAYRSESETRRHLAEAQRKLDEAEHVELVGRLAGGVAHDVNNALTAILAASDLLGDKVGSDVQRANLAELEGASHHAAELVRDLLWIGRKFPPTTTTAQVDTTVRACLVRLERMGRKIELDVQMPELRVALAPERLEQVLFRMVLRAHRTGVRQLAVTARRTDSMVVIDLRGGERSASPSASLHARHTAVSAGLAMSAAKEVVEQAGGTLTMIDNDDQLLFQLCVPPAADDLAPVVAGRGRPRTALVVDDEPLVLRRLTKLIARRGYTVLSASSLAEAWPLLATAPDLLVTDLQLGDGRGEELAVASFARDPHRPIVICSGFGADDTLLEELRGARAWFLTKPFTMAELDDVIPLAEAAA